MGKVALSSSAYKYPRRGCQKRGVGKPKQKGISGRKKKEKEGEPKRRDRRRKRRAGRIFLKRK
jgi:hypothetical protein